MRRLLGGVALGAVASALAMMIAGRAGVLCALLGTIAGVVVAKLDETGRTASRD